MLTDSATDRTPNAPQQLLGLVHGLSNFDYHRGPGLSNSGLKDLKKSPWHYHARHHLEHPAWFIDELDEDTTGTLFAGTLCHCAALEPAEFDVRYVVGPNLDRRTKEWKDFVKANAGRQVISVRQHGVAFAQAAALRAVPAVAEILDGGECEVSAYWIDPATGVYCRCRPDCANRTFGTPDAPAAMLLDLKTTRDASPRAIRKTIADYAYHRQAEHYSRGFAAAARMPVAGFIFAFVEQAWPFACAVVELDAEAYEVARRDNRELLELYARCEAAGIWPGYSTEVEFVSLPRWAGGSE